MNAPLAHPRRRVGPIHPAVRLLALAMVAGALAVRLLLVSAAAPHHASLWTDDSQALAGRHAPPVSERAAVACLRTAVAVTAVEPSGADVRVRLLGVRAPMTIRFASSDVAAIRYSYAHGSPNNFYANTNWFGTPAPLTRPEMDALGSCLPLGGTTH